MEETLKQCNDCYEYFPLTSFAKHSKSKDGYHYYCLPCHRNRSKINYEKRKEELKDKFRRILKKYNLTKEDYNKLLLKQKLKCVICSVDLDLLNLRSGQGACVDHCHKTLKVRGILCNHCNRLLGLARDNVAILQQAIIYLQENNGD